MAAASVKVHIAYGFAGVRRLDLEAYTNNEGKVTFTGLPARVRRPPLEFRSSKDQFAGTAVYDPEAECHAKHEIDSRSTDEQPATSQCTARNLFRHGLSGIEKIYRPAFDANQQLHPH